MADERQLPRKIERVLEAAVHAVALEGRANVRCVPSQQDTVRPEPPCDFRMAVEARRVGDVVEADGWQVTADRGGSVGHKVGVWRARPQIDAIAFPEARSGLPESRPNRRRSPRRCLASPPRLHRTLPRGSVMSCPLGSIPLNFRVVLWSPSHPTIHWTVTFTIVPSRWIVARRPSSCSSSPMRLDERMTSPPCCWRYSVSIDSVTSSEMQMLNP
jgi:hypothetical protein